MPNIRQLLYRARFPLLLLLICILGYALLIPWLGFYADDWYIVWFEKTFGGAQFTKFFAQDRPLLAWSYVLFTPIFKASRLGWQIFDFFTRYLMVLTFWWVLQQVWPRDGKKIRWVVLLFLIFPGFSEHWESVQYSQINLIYAGYLFSIGMMLAAFRNPRRWWVYLLPAWLLGTYSLFAVEYFFGLEILRPLFLWLMVHENGKTDRKMLRRGAGVWSPFIITLIGFTIWRVFFWRSYMYDIQSFRELTGGSLKGLATLVQSVWIILQEAALEIWGRQFGLFKLPLTQELIMMWALVAITLAVLWAYLYFSRGSGAKLDEAASGNWPMHAMGVGLIVLFTSMVPFRMAGLSISLMPPFDRFMIILSIGSTLFLVGLLEFLIAHSRKREMILVLLISLSVATQFRNANVYRRTWEHQEEFLQQLAWRVPGLEPGTILLAKQVPFDYYYSDFSLSAPLNLIYNQPVVDREVSYQFIFTGLRLRFALKSLEKDEPVVIDERSFTFHGNTSKAVVFSYQTDRCLNILDPNFASSEALYLEFSNEALTLARLSRPELIRVDQPSPKLPESIFGPEPKHDWCYYYEKADLARQAGDWKTVLALLKEVRAQGMKPKADSEWYPFIAAYAMTGQWDLAGETLLGLYPGNVQWKKGLCLFWDNLGKLLPDPQNPGLEYQRIRRELQCQQ